MKRFYTIILTLMILSVVISEAQLLQPYKVREGVNTAYNSALAATKDPKLMLAATVAGEFDFNGMKITIAFDEAKGASQAWVYQYRGTNPDTSITIGVAKTAFGMQTIPLDPGTFGVPLPFQPTATLDGFKWMNSDSMMLAVNQNADYQTFKTRNPDQKLQMTGLAVEPMSNSPIWGVVFNSKNGGMNCMVDAVTGMTTCLDLTGIEENSTSSVRLYPNPASDFAILNISTIQGVNDIQLKIYSTNGELVSSITNPTIDGTGSVGLNISNINSGIYIVQTIIDGKSSTKTLIISR
jgi:hypothetical protein